MSVISENIRSLRKRAGYTQQELADRIGIKRSLVGAYEEARAEPPIENLLKFADTFAVSIDQLVDSDLTTGFPESNAQDSRLKVLAVTVDPEERENIDLVPQKAAAGYTNGYADPEYIKELPKFQLPVLPRNGTYRAFEISGDSMLPVQPGTVIIGKYIEGFQELKNGKTYVLVTEQEGVVYKRVFNYVKDKGTLYLVSDNRQFAPYEIEADQVREIWEAVAYIALNMPEPSGDQDPMTLEKLTKVVMDLQKEIIRLKQ